MAGSYGAETTQGERYRLSFTVGGLLSPQGRALAEMYLNRMGGGSTERSSQTKVSEKISEKVNEKSDKSADEEVGESIATIRQQAIEENVLAIRTDSANRRVVAETTRRLSALTVGELAYLAGPDSSTSDREALMWIVMCRYYAIVGEFAGEVLKKHYLVGNLHLGLEDYARFIANKATWHPELEAISEGTAKKLRSNLFKAMVEAHLFDKNSDTVVSFLPSPSLADLLMKRPDSFGFSRCVNHPCEREWGIARLISSQALKLPMSTVILMISLICTRLWSPYYICDYPLRQELIEESYQYVLCDIHMGVWFKGVHWQDVYEIPSDAICELIVNASALQLQLFEHSD